VCVFFSGVLGSSRFGPVRPRFLPLSNSRRRAFVSPALAQMPPCNSGKVHIWPSIWAATARAAAFAADNSLIVTTWKSHYNGPPASLPGAVVFDPSGTVVQSVADNAIPGVPPILKNGSKLATFLSLATSPAGRVFGLVKVPLTVGGYEVEALVERMDPSGLTGWGSWQVRSFHEVGSAKVDPYLEEQQLQSPQWNGQYSPQLTCTSEHCVFLTKDRDSTLRFIVASTNSTASHSRVVSSEFCCGLTLREASVVGKRRVTTGRWAFDPSVPAELGFKGLLRLELTDIWGHTTCQGVNACAKKMLDDCDDGNPCTEEGCDLVGTCTHKPKVDGLPCGDGQICKAGKCDKP